jgi:hypothetical protein
MSANTLLNASFLSDSKNCNKQNGGMTVWYTKPTSLNNKMSEFRCRLVEEKPYLIFITETWWNETSTPFIEIYSLYRRDRETTKGGGIYVSNKITSAEVVGAELCKLFGISTMLHLRLVAIVWNLSNKMETSKRETD